MDHLPPSPELTNAIQGVLTLPWTEELQMQLVKGTFDCGFESYAEGKEAIQTLRERVGRSVLAIAKEAEQGRFTLEACLQGSVSIKMSDEPPADQEYKINEWQASAADELSELLIDIATEAYIDQNDQLVTALSEEAQRRNDEYEAGEEWNDALDDHVTKNKDSEIDDKQLVISLLKDELTDRNVTDQLTAKLLPPPPEEKLSDASHSSSEAD